MLILISTSPLMPVMKSDTELLPLAVLKVHRVHVVVVLTKTVQLEMFHLSEVTVQKDKLKISL
jgi:hypothetical protein